MLLTYSLCTGALSHVYLIGRDIQRRLLIPKSHMCNAAPYHPTNHGQLTSDPMLQSILATVADNLDFKSVCRSAEVLAGQGSAADPNYSKLHQVSQC